MYSVWDGPGAFETQTENRADVVAVCLTMPHCKFIFSGAGLGDLLDVRRPAGMSAAGLSVQFVLLFIFRFCI